MKGADALRIGRGWPTVDGVSYPSRCAERSKAAPVMRRAANGTGPVLHLTRLRLLGWLAVMLLTVHAGALGGSAQTPPPPPPGVAASASGPEIYVTDFDNNRIVRMDDMTGAGWVALGSLGPGANQLHEPTGIAVDPSGRIVVADSWNDRMVRMEDMTGHGWRALGTHASLLTGGTFLKPQGIGTDGEGNIYLADAHCVWRINAAMSGGWLAGKCFPIKQYYLVPQKTPYPVTAGGLVLDKRGRIYITDTDGGRVARMDDSHGTGWIAVGTRGAGALQLNAPRGIAIDSAARIYVADSGNNRIVRMDDIAGTGWTTFGTQGSGVNQFGTPSGVAVDALGRIYVADSDNKRIVRIDDMTGTGWTTLGTQGTGVNQFGRPFGVCLR